MNTLGTPWWIRISAAVVGLVIFTALNLYVAAVELWRMATGKPSAIGSEE